MADAGDNYMVRSFIISATCCIKVISSRKMSEACGRRDRNTKEKCPQGSGCNT